jgi:hypothetical protein
MTQNPFNRFLTSLLRAGYQMELLDPQTWYSAVAPTAASLTIKVGAYGNFGPNNSPSSRVYNMQLIFV